MWLHNKMGISDIYVIRLWSEYENIRHCYDKNGKSFPYLILFYLISWHINISFRYLPAGHQIMWSNRLWIADRFRTFLFVSTLEFFISLNYLIKHIATRLVLDLWWFLNRYIIWRYVVHRIEKRQYQKRIVVGKAPSQF